MIHSLLVLLAMNALCAALVAEEHPFKATKVGDWIEYKLTNSLQEEGANWTMKMTVTAKNDKEVTMKTESKVKGSVVPRMPGEKAKKVRLDQPFDPSELTGQTFEGAANLKSEKLSEGEEVITVNGKKVDCKWMEMKTTADAPGGQKPEVKYKVWIAKEGIPMGGLVKMVPANDLTSTWEAIGWGKGK